MQSLPMSAYFAITLKTFSNGGPIFPTLSLIKNEAKKKKLNKRQIFTKVGPNINYSIQINFLK